ncbi:MAG TPA: helix-turn-helix transcriptional regulator [Armatimonadota bacterium]|nr:helix-turn-helix transcriptional regulator [Armatimonadota bacterium]
MDETFGAYIKRLRLERNLSLREFCLRIKADPSNYSKLERGLHYPPEDARLSIYEEALELEPDGAETRELRRLAALGRGMVPPGVLSDQELASKLPLFFRTLEGEPLNEEKLDEVIEMIRAAWTPETSYLEG